MTNTFTYSFILMALLSLVACEKETQNLELTLSLNYGDSPLVMLNEYKFPTGELIKFTRFSFFISDIEATVSGQSSDVRDVDFLNLTASHSSVEAAQVGLNYTLTGLKKGTLESLDFMLGVTPELNKKVPSDFSPDEPLANPGEYWIAWDSYIFLKIEAIADLDGDGETETNVALHIGSDQAARQVRLPLEGSNKQNITIDVKSIFENDTSSFDLQNNPQIHSLSQIEQAQFLMDNFSKTF